MKTKIFSHPFHSFGSTYGNQTQKSGDFLSFFFPSLLAIETPEAKKKKKKSIKF
jgi:hypothetical protein